VDGTTLVNARNARRPVPGGPFTVAGGIRRLPPAVGLCRELLGGSGAAPGSAAAERAGYRSGAGSSS
jgi:hypothetical protein